MEAEAGPADFSAKLAGSGSSGVAAEKGER
jgi:hypothetical protein